MGHPLHVAIVLLWSTVASAGPWEGVIEDPARPIVVQVDFEHHWAKLDSAGSAPFSLEHVAVTGTRIAFQVEVGAHRFDFAGTKSQEIRGTVRFADHEVPFWLRRLPELPAPKNRVEAWQQDLDALETRFLQYDRSFAPEAGHAFLKQLVALRLQLQNVSDQAIMVELARSLALAGNGHTRLYLLRNRTEVRQIPVRVWWFRDSLHVVRATREHVDLLGCRVLNIGEFPVERASARVRGIDSGTLSWQRYMSTYFLTSPDILFGAGVIPDASQVTLELSCAGEPRRVELASPPLQKSTQPVEAWWNLAPSHRDAAHPMASALASTNVPLYLRRPEENYWFEYIPEHRVLYIQYNRAQEMPSGPTLKQFTAAIANALESEHPRAVVFDLRFNTSGNLFLATPLVKLIASYSARTAVFVITGRATFSAGISAAAELEQWAHATIVGEPVGDSLDFWAEGGNLILPNSGLAAHYASGFHAYSKQPYPGRNIYVDLNVDTLQPEIEVEPTWSDYLKGTDVVLDAILKRIDSRS